MSIPSMLTGSAYRNQEPMRRFIAKEFDKASIFRTLRDQGYRVDAVSGLMYDKPSTTNYYRLPTPYVTYDAYVKFAGWQRRTRRNISLGTPLAYFHKPAATRGVELKVRSSSDKPQTLTVELRGKVIDTQVLDDTTGIR